MDLELCPFCNGQPYVAFSGSKFPNRWKGAIVVKCLCGATMFGAMYDGEPITSIALEDTLGAERAIEKWNRRVYKGV